MIAFHGKSEVKDLYLKRVREHRAADQIVQGFGYWGKAGGKFQGCAVGCTLHSDDHKSYETELGIPTILARLEDGIFENLPKDRSLAWPEEFLTAPQVGADLSFVWPRFAVWMLVDPEWGVIKFAKTDRSREAIQRVADLYAKKIVGGEVTEQEFSDAAYAADAADAAYAAYAASAAKRHEIRVAQADKLLELMAEAPVMEPAR